MSLALKAMVLAASLGVATLGTKGVLGQSEELEKCIAATASEAAACATSSSFNAEDLMSEECEAAAAEYGASLGCLSQVYLKSTDPDCTDYQASVASKSINELASEACEEVDFFCQFDCEDAFTLEAASELVKSVNACSEKLGFSLLLCLEEIDGINLFGECDEVSKPSGRILGCSIEKAFESSVEECKAFEELFKSSSVAEADEFLRDGCGVGITEECYGLCKEGFLETAPGGAKKALTGGANNVGVALLSAAAALVASVLLQA